MKLFRHAFACLAAAACMLAGYQFAPSANAQQPKSAVPAPSAQPQWNWPERMANAKVLRPDTPPDRLREIMRDFTRTIGVRCSFCHVGQESQPLSAYDFASDANPHKEVA